VAVHALLMDALSDVQEETNVVAELLSVHTVAVQLLPMLAATLLQLETATFSEIVGAGQVVVVQLLLADSADGEQDKTGVSTALF
jgi:hypothetical protein